MTGVCGDPRSATGKLFLDIHAEALAATMRGKPMWRKPDPVWTVGCGQGAGAGHADD